MLIYVVLGLRQAGDQGIRGQVSGSGGQGNLSKNKVQRLVVHLWQSIQLLCVSAAACEVGLSGKEMAVLYAQRCRLEVKAIAQCCP